MDNENLPECPRCMDCGCSTEPGYCVGDDDGRVWCLTCLRLQVTAEVEADRRERDRREEREEQGFKENADLVADSYRDHSRR